MRKIISAIIFTLFVSTGYVTAESLDLRIPLPPTHVATNTYIVSLKDGALDPGVVRKDLESRLRRSLSRSDVYHSAISGFTAQLNPQEVADLKKDPSVESVVEDMPVSIASQGVPTGIGRINGVSKPNKGAGIEVAVLDTGIDTAHPDLAGNIVGGKNCSTGASYSDVNGHGTHVAGVIAALDNDIGVVGVAPSAKLWAVRVLDDAGNGTWSSVICGLDFVTANAPKNGGKIKVANLSLTGPGKSDGACGRLDGDPLHKAMCRARDAGVTIVVAAGNSGLIANNYAPATYNDAVITVSALIDTDGAPFAKGPGTTIGGDDTIAKFSNYGYALDIAAPGVLITSTYPGGRYATMSGTSMATPHVSGAVALYLSTHTSARWTEVRDALRNIGEKVNSGHTDPTRKHVEPVLNVSSL